MDRETLAIDADAGGRITARTGGVLVRDGAILIPHDVLAERPGIGKAPPRGAYRATCHTAKGKAAFERLSGFFGL